MKKFLIVSISLILVAAVAFGASLFHYIDVTKDDSTPSQVSKNDKENKKEDKEDKKEPVVDAKMPSDWNDNGIFKDNYDKAYSYVLSLSDEQLVGQVLIGTCPIDDTASTTATKFALSGYVFSADNFAMMDESGVKEHIASFNKNASTPMIMAVKEEGGAVTAISDLDAFPQYDFYSPRDIFAQGGLDALKESEQQKADMLKSVGINLNLAPVCDMGEEMNHIMYSRSLGGTTQDTCDYVSNTTEISQSKGVSVALKHFPGYGTCPDTLESVVVDTREISTFETNDFKPFEAGVNKGAHVVMMSNALVQNLDPNCVVSLSDYAHTVLMDRIGFSGLIMTDNLNNADYSAYANGNDVYVQAVLAGNDLVMVSNVEEAYKAILGGLNDGTIDKEILQKACTRVVAYKYLAGIMD